MQEKMINKVVTIEYWLYQLQLEKLDVSELDMIKEPIEIPESEICTAFNELVSIVSNRYAASSFIPDYSILGLRCELPKEQYSPRYVLGVFVK